MKRENFSGVKALIMGLGLNGGNLAAALYLAERGAELTVTDLRDEVALAPSIKELSAYPVRYVLGKHEMGDFERADLVIKNAGVRPDSPYLQKVKRIETDISLFLKEFSGEILAVTGTKGKSSVSSALHHVLDQYSTAHSGPKARLGGNIALSPLSFLPELTPQDHVVLELSSFQLGDLMGRDLLKPRAVVMTPIMRDHLDRYGTMEAYIADKRVIYRNQTRDDVIVAQDDDWGRSFISESKARPLVYGNKVLDEGISGGWIGDPQGPGYARLYESYGQGRNFKRGELLELVPERPLVPGAHQKQNLLMAGLALLDLGLPAEFIRDSLGTFKGVEHRLEFFHESRGIRFYNDSAASIPEAAAAAVLAFAEPPILVCGGTDKDLDFGPLIKVMHKAKAIFLIEGTASEKVIPPMEKSGLSYRGPYSSFDALFSDLEPIALPGDTVVLSPGCTSFGMFLNEFYRGQAWKEGVRRYFP